MSPYTDTNSESQQHFSSCNWSRHQRILFLFWWNSMCWNAKVILLSSILTKYFWWKLFCLSLSIEYSCSESERSQLAYVTFKDSKGADTAMLLSVCLWGLWVWFEVHTCWMGCYAWESSLCVWHVFSYLEFYWWIISMYWSRELL